MSVILTEQPLPDDGASIRFLSAVLRHGMRARRGQDDDGFRGISHAQAGRQARLSRPSIYNHAKEMREAATPVLRTDELAIRPGSGYSIGIDFGRLHDTRVMLADIHGWPIEVRPGDENRQRELPAESPEDALSRAEHEVRSLLDKHVIDPTQLVGIGISIPGPVGPDNKAILGRIADGWTEYDAIAELSKRLGFEKELFVIGNDAYLSAVAERLWGVTESDDFTYVKWASDLRAAVIVAGRLYEGHNHMAGDLPHVCVNDTDIEDTRAKDPNITRAYTPCGICGERRCVHAVTRLDTLSAIAGSSKERPLRAARIIERAEDREEVEAAMKLAARAISRAVEPYVAVLDPEVVVLGGALGGRAYPLVSNELKVHLPRAGENATAVQILGAALRRRTAVTGAMALALLERGPQYLHNAATGQGTE